MIARLVTMAKELLFGGVTILADLLAQCGLERAPFAMYAKALSLWPEHRAVLLGALGSLYGKVGKPEEGIAHLKEAIAMEPSDPLSYVCLAELYESCRRWDAAAKMYDLVLSSMREGLSDDTIRRLHDKSAQVRRFSDTGHPGT
jgi:tetratricopeptide (TPR) repeat protein